MQVHGEHIAEIGAGHHEDALRDINDVEDAEYQRQPDGHQCVDPAFENSVGDGRVDLATHVGFLCPPCIPLLLAWTAAPGGRRDPADPV